MTSSPYLSGRFLLAMPALDGSGFGRSVIYMCSHDEEGAMGIVINKPFELLDFAGLLEQLEIEAEHVPAISIHEGGPVEPGRGFVLHSNDYNQESTLVVDQDNGVTATVDILKAIVEGNGPKRHLIALGYAGWGSGQLEREIQENSWMISDGDADIMFATPVDDKWPRAMATLGIDPGRLSSEAGHA